MGTAHGRRDHSNRSDCVSIRSISTRFHNGNYEWRGEKGAKQPYYFQPAGNEAILWIAGLASRWQGLLTCTMMTRAANASVEPIHDRMPVILDTGEQSAWLAGSDDLEIGAGARLRHHPVRPFGIADEGADLIEPVE